MYSLLWQDNIWPTKKICNQRVKKEIEILRKSHLKLSKCQNNQKLSFDIFTVLNLQHIFMEHDLYLIS